MKVYLLYGGWEYEGYEVLGVYADEAEAIAECDRRAAAARRSGFPLPHDSYSVSPPFDVQGVANLAPQQSPARPGPEQAATGDPGAQNPSAPLGDPSAPLGDPSAPLGDPSAPLGDPSAPYGCPTADPALFEPERFTAGCIEAMRAPPRRPWVAPVGNPSTP